MYLARPMFRASPMHAKGLVMGHSKGSVTLWPCHLHKKGILRQKKNYENSNISPCKNIIFKKSSKRNHNPSRYYNSITNLKFQHKPKYIIFQKSSYKNRPITT
jgi:hypothetical protein